MKISLIPVLFVVVFVSIIYAARVAMRKRMVSPSGGRWIVGILATYAAWGAVSAYFTITGLYHSGQSLRLWAPVWLPLFATMLIIAPVKGFPQARTAVKGLIDSTPLYALVAIHGLRVLAIGTIVKAWLGEFSAPFAIFVGVPDFLFGLTAIVVAWLAFNNRIGTMSIAIWNLIGFAVIVPGVFIVTLLSLPGPWQVFSAAPTIMTLYDFPMALAPTLIVPLFITMNLLVAERLVTRNAEFPVCDTSESGHAG